MMMGVKSLPENPRHDTVMWRLIALVLAAMCWVGVQAQGHINPVDRDDEKPQQPVLHHYDKHGNPLTTPVLFLADLDTVTKVKSKPVYPLFNGINVGINFLDALFIACGQSYGSFGISADVSLHNWFMPVVEAGIGYVDSHPDGGQFHVKSKASPYVKVGADYNFLYKSNPDYQFYLGLRAGMGITTYDVTDISPGCEWYEKDGPKAYGGIKCTSWYGQALAGLRVRLAGPVSMGWTVRYGFFFSKSREGMKCPPWYVAGFGHNPLTATMSVYYTIR